MTKILNFGLKIKGGGREGGTCEVLRPCPRKRQSQYYSASINSNGLLTLSGLLSLKFLLDITNNLFHSRRTINCI